MHQPELKNTPYSSPLIGLPDLSSLQIHKNQSSEEQPGQPCLADAAVNAISSPRDTPIRLLVFTVAHPKDYRDGTCSAQNRKEDPFIPLHPPLLLTTWSLS